MVVVKVCNDLIGLSINQSACSIVDMSTAEEFRYIKEMKIKTITETLR